MPKSKIIIFALGAAIILLAVLFLFLKKERPPIGIPHENFNELPTKLKVIIKELEDEEYIGLTQREIEERLRKKGIRF